MTYRNDIDFEALAEEARAAGQAAETRAAQEEAAAEENVRGLVEYLKSRGLDARLTRYRGEMARHLFVEAKAPNWPANDETRSFTFRVADVLSEVTPEAVHRLAALPGFVRAVDDLVLWRECYTVGDKAKERFLVIAWPVCTVACLVAVAFGVAANAAFILTVLSLGLTWLIGAYLHDRAYAAHEESLTK